VVHLKNIDNVVPDRAKDAVCLWQKLLIGRLGRLQDEIFDLIAALRRGMRSAEEEAKRFLRKQFFLSERNSSRKSLLALLDRPLRVCGVVENEGEPGGGPFWVGERSGGPSPQIVEKAEMAGRSEREMRIFVSARYFNPVNLVCGLRDWRGKTFDLSRFTDPEAVIVARKTEGGREVRALEWPGLWNGGMAHWNTVFVECPAETFAPVKTLEDLARPAHAA
jgi:hypothetical protein